MPRIQLTGISMHDPAAQELMGLSDEPLNVEIDSSLPWIYLPPDLAGKSCVAHGSHEKLTVRKQRS
jgi:hypothetical protein